MITEQIFPIDKKTLELFAAKGTKNNKPRIDNPNAFKVRRVIQIIRDLAKKPFEELWILDLACGEGVYAIEAALRGAEVRALDARTERMSEGMEAADRLGLKKLYFEQADVRKIKIEAYSNFDVILFLGILYHLDCNDIFSVLKNIYEMCKQLVIIDTHIALQSVNEVKYDGRIYEGKQYREHGDDDPEELRRSKLLASIDNTLSFWFTKESLFRLLNDVGFTSVCECSVPLEPNKPADRITIIAMKGEPVLISSYQWVNKMG